MSYDTTVRATSEVDWRMMFLQARKAVGIPAEWPFDHFHRDFLIHGWLMSEPGGFGAGVSCHHGEDLRNDGEDGAAACVVFTTSGPYDDVEVLHELYVAELGEWLSAHGVSFEVFVNGELTQVAS